jgi:NAD(P)H-dependent FMN reductase
MKPTIVTVVGTSRPGNLTRHALAVVEDEISRLGGAVARLDAAELSLAFPGHPETDDAKRLRSAVAGAAGVVLASPEYHGTFCAMTKLIIENLGFPSALAGRPVALLGVAAGRIGAIKSLEHLRGVCAHVGALVVPNAVSLAGVQSAFDVNGRVRDAGSEAALRGLAKSLIEFMKTYVCPRHTLEAMARGERVEPWTTTV